MLEDRFKILSLINEAQERGAGKEAVCSILGVDLRTIQRWEKDPLRADSRKGPTQVSHALSDSEKVAIVKTCNEARFRNLSPSQIVPLLADEGTYIASERSFYRVLAENEMNKERTGSKPRTNKKPEAIVANNPLEVWSWDITYLQTHVRGMYYYLYMVIDIYSRMIVGWELHEEQTSEVSSEMMKRICKEHGIGKGQIILHSDNGSPMKGSTMVATLQRLGVIPSFNRPSVSSDNAYSESLFKTLKYRPGYPSNGFKTLDDARKWVTEFINWYNHEHLHSEIKFVTPYSRHTGQDEMILEQRTAVYEAAMKTNPGRWLLGKTRSWKRPGKVGLNNPNLRKNRQTVMVEAA